jgi:HK97 family phage prohead protease
VADKGNIATAAAAELNAAARAYATMQGWAMPNGGYPIRPANMHGADDLTSACKAVGRGNTGHDAIRKHIINRAHSIGLSDQLPDNWSANGGLTGAGGGNRSAEVQTMYRTFTPDIEIRSGGDGRTVEGIAVPFDTPYYISDQIGYESFDRSAFNHQLSAVHRVPFYAPDHKRLGGPLVGKMTRATPDVAGLRVELRVDKTRAGDEALEMIRSGTLPHLSVGFLVGARGTEMRPGPVQHRVKADLTEIAAAPLGAYGEDAAIAGVRSVYGADATPNLEQARQLIATLPVLRTG